MPISSVNNSQTITVAKYNEIQSAIAGVLSYYGVTPSSVAVSTAGTKITVENQWGAVYADANKCIIHQTNADIVGVSVPTTASVASAAYTNSLITVVNAAETNKDVVSALQLSSAASGGSSTRVSNFGSGTAIVHTTVYAWPSAGALTTFFNTGGYLAASIAKTGTVDVDLSVLINSAISALASNTYRVKTGNLSSPLTYTDTVGVHTLTVTFTKTNATTWTCSVSLLSATLQALSGATITASVSCFTSVNTTAGGGIAGGILGTAPTAEVTATFEGSAAPIAPTTSLSASPSSLSYSFLTGAASSAAQTITLTNNGNSGIVITGITSTLSGPVTYTPVYSWGASLPVTINGGGATRTFTVAYAGTVAGTHNNAITISTNGTPSTITIPATQVIAGFTLSPSSRVVTLTSAAPSSQLFSITGSNINPVLATSYTASVSGTGFSVSQTALGPTVTFTPGALANGVYSGTLTVTMNGYTTTASLSITLALVTQNLGNWVSATAETNAVVGLSYDIISGSRYLTVGIGMNADGAEALNNFGSSSINVNNLNYGADPYWYNGMPLYAGYTPNEFGGWNTFLKSSDSGGFGVTVKYRTWLPNTSFYLKRTYLFIAPNAGTYTSNFSVDDYGYVEISNGSGGFDVINDERGTYRPYERVNTATWTAPAAGTYTLNLYFQNTFRHGQVAYQLINNTTGLDVASTNIPVRTAYQYWAEVYRIPLDQGAYTYQCGNYCVKDTSIANGYRYGEFFDNQSPVAVTDDGSGNLSIVFNQLSGTNWPPASYDDQQTVLNIPYLPYYYSDNGRYANLEAELSGSQTRYFLGFNALGVVQTSVVASPGVPTDPTIPTGGGGGSGIVDVATSGVLLA